MHNAANCPGEKPSVTIAAPSTTTPITITTAARRSNGARHSRSMPRLSIAPSDSSSPLSALCSPFAHCHA
jgi:hypothetical protein